MQRRLRKKAISAIEHAMRGHRLTFPTDEPVIRIAFDRKPSWQMLPLIEGFDFDVSIVFEQPINITDAYYGCFEADFQPTNKQIAALNTIKDKVSGKSDFDNLVVKYDIAFVKLLNFAHIKEKVFEVIYNKETWIKRATGVV